MKHFRPVLATLIIALSAMGLVESVASNTESESASSDRLVRGILITLDDVDRPECSTSLQGFVYDDGEETTACMDNQWQSVVIDADGDGHVRGTDEDDNDATDKGDSDLVPANIKSGVDIFDIEGTLVVSSVVDNDADGITSTLDEDDNDATDKGDSDLVAANIKKGVSIFGVTGTYPTPSSETYDTVSAGYNHHTGYGLRVGTLAGHAYCKGQGKDEMSSYNTMTSQGGVGLSFRNNRLTVTEGRGGGYSTFRSITCSDLNL